MLESFSKTKNIINAVILLSSMFFIPEDYVNTELEIIIIICSDKTLKF